MAEPSQSDGTASTRKRDLGSAVVAANAAAGGIAGLYVTTHSIVVTLICALITLFVLVCWVKTDRKSN
jgi:hypothetical protein